ncbi:MAG: 2-hydroxyacid dehydrogenase, partial [Pseudomonadales bacterium]|nr:2-hydroxyacid dehydrogenase [Pseudomonadales bacterium]
VALQDLLGHSQIISLHCPLNEASHHMINQKAIDSMQDNVMLINTSRGAVVDTRAVINGLKSKKIGYLGMDVYEMESELFFEDKSLEVMQDDVFSRLVSFPNVVITGHQGFYTHEALEQIAATTLANISLCAQNKTSAETFVLGTTAAR